jgi:hypothetical protein
MADHRNGALGRGLLDMVEPAYILFQTDGRGEFKLGCVVGGIGCALYTDAAEFTWEGNDEMDEASWNGWAELIDNGAIQAEITLHSGDESTFQARRW